MNKRQKPTAEMTALLKASASRNREVQVRAMRALAQALEAPLREGLLNGDIYSDIFVDERLDPSATAEYPLDLYQQHDDGQYVAYNMPSVGAIPLRSISGDSITLQTYGIANAIDWPLKLAREARWNIIARAMEVFEAGFVRKLNTDAWRTIISAGAGRTDYGGGAPLVYDDAATPGQFTKRLVSLMKTSMTRLAGGNTATLNRGLLTDLYLSPEALEDMRDWDVDEVDEITRREIFQYDGQGSPLASIYGVMLHPLTELGDGQEFQTYYETTLGESMGASDEEIVVGLDLSDRDSFVMPIKQPLEIYEDDTLHRRQMGGFYGWQDQGLGVLDPRRVLLASF